MEVNKVSQAEAVRNFYRRQGAEQEQLRIIKLLEEHLPLLETKDASERDLQAFGYAIRLFKGEVIALIKGENK